VREWTRIAVAEGRAARAAREHYWRNAEVVRERSRQYYYNRGGYRYRPRSPAMRAANRRYWYKKRGAGGSHSERDWLRLLNRHNGTCAYCQVRPATQRDHVLPIKLGGTSYIGNILPACATCNGSKGGKLLIDWKRRGGEHMLKGSKQGGNQPAHVAKPIDAGTPSSNGSAPKGESRNGGPGPGNPGNGKRPH